MTVTDQLLEQCLRALHHAPANKPSLALLLDMHGNADGLKAAIEVAITAGRESVWAEAETEYRVCRTYPTASGKLCIDQFGTLEDARDAAEHYAASDPTKSNHWVERTEMAEREVPLRC